MIVVITSCAPTVAFRKPAIPAQAAPAAAATIPSRMCAGRAMCTNETPIQFAQMRPTRYWPLPPMLNRPQRKAKATARPRQDQRRRLQQGLAEVVRGRVRDIGVPGMREPVQAGAVDDVPVGLERVVAGRGDDHAADQERDQRRDHGRDDPARALPRREPRGDRCEGGAWPISSGCGPCCGASGSLTRARRLLAPCRRASRARSRPRSRPTCAPDDLALVHDEDAVGEREHLVELQGDEQDRAALVALFDEAAVQVLDRSDVEAASGLRGDRAPSGRARPRARRRASAGCRRRARRRGVCGPPPRTSNSLIRLARALRSGDVGRASRSASPAAGCSRAARCSRRSRTRARARGAGGPRGCGRRPTSSIRRALGVRITSPPTSTSPTGARAGR